MNNLTQRILTAIALLFLIFYVVFKAPIIWFVAFVLLLILMGLFELLKLMQSSLPEKILSGLTVILTCMIVLIGLTTHHLFAVLVFPITIIWWLANAWMVINYPKLKPNQRFLPVNAALLLAPMVGLVGLYTKDVQLLVLLLFIVWGADTFAYLSGKAFGRHKLTPRLSDGKTIEGVIGGLISGLGITGVWMLLTDNLDWRFLLVALITVIFSVVGDLYESIYKREAGVKDSGNILPGHGGVLDRIDGLLAATPVFIVMVFFL